MSQTAYVFGATGFVGGQLTTRLLRDGFNVVALGRAAPAQIVDPSLREVYRQWNGAEGELTTEFAPGDTLFHLAADLDVRRSFEAPEAMIERNTAMTLAVLRAARTARVPPAIVYLSSDRVYGNRSGALSEETLPGPVDPYGASKLASEEIMRCYSASFGLRVTILRASNLYGPQQRPIQFIPSVIKKILDGTSDVTIGDVSSSRNFLYIDDLVDACILAVGDGTETAFGLFNVAGKVHTLRDVCDVIRERAAAELGRDIKFVADPTLFRPAGSKMSEAAVVSSLKFTQRFGWSPKVGMAEGIARTLREGVGEMGMRDAS